MGAAAPGRDGGDRRGAQAGAVEGTGRRRRVAVDAADEVNEIEAFLTDQRGVIVMSRFLLAVALIGFAPPSSLAQPPRPKLDADASRARDYIKAHYTKYEYRIPMRDGVRLFTAVYVPKDDSQTYPILLTRTPYSVGPYGADQYPRRRSARRRCSPRRATSSSTRTCAAGGCPRASSSTCGRTTRTRGPKDIDESSDTYDTIDWLLKNVPGHNGKVGQWGISYPGFYTAAGMIDAHPALKAVVAAGAGRRLVRRRRLPPQRGALPAALLQLHGQLRQAAAGADARSRDPPFDHGTPDGYDFFLEHGPARRTPTRSTSRARSRSGTR